MEWIKSKDQLPNNYKKVLVYDGSNFYMAKYHRDPDRFITELKRDYEIEVNDNVYWLDPIPPNKN